MTWKIKSTNPDKLEYECPYCKGISNTQSPFCPNCGKRVINKIDTLLYTADISIGIHTTTKDYYYKFGSTNFWRKINLENLHHLKNWLNANI